MRVPGLLLSGLTLALLTGEATANTYYLYAPTQVTEQQAREKANDAVAVQEITVAKGDSLYRISRRNSGRGMYYPQLLLFNKIANPDRIYPGQILRIPYLQHHKSTTAAKPAKSEQPVPIVESTPAAEPAAVIPPAPQSAQKKAAATKVPPARKKIAISAEQTLYAKGVQSYKSGQCRQAITAFDRFLATYPDSPLTADVSLYRADCYLALAGK